jgi:triacylglycerol lipase
MIHATAENRVMRPSRVGISRFIREWIAHIVLVALLPLGLRRAPPPVRVSAREGMIQRAPVILVPGFLMNRATMWFLQLYLRRRGWEWVWSINNRRNTAIPVMASALAARVDQLQSASGAAKVDLVGHSMGGIVSAWYASQLDGAANIRRIVTLGTPWKGTRMHIWGPGVEAKDLSPDSDVIAQVQAPPVPVTAIWSPVDQLLIPGDCARCDGHENIVVEQCGHMEMLLSARVLRKVREVLSRKPELAEDESA